MIRTSNNEVVENVPAWVIETILSQEQSRATERENEDRRMTPHPQRARRRGRGRGRSTREAARFEWTPERTTYLVRLRVRFARDVDVWKAVTDEFNRTLSTNVLLTPTTAEAHFVYIFNKSTGDVHHYLEQFYKAEAEAFAFKGDIFGRTSVIDDRNAV